MGTSTKHDETLVYVSKHKVALEAVRVIRDYVACLRSSQGRDVVTLLRARAEEKESGGVWR